MPFLRPCASHVRRQCSRNFIPCVRFFFGQVGYLTNYLALKMIFRPVDVRALRPGSSSVWCRTVVSSSTTILLRQEVLDTRLISSIADVMYLVRLSSSLGTENTRAGETGSIRTYYPLMMSADRNTRFNAKNTIWLHYDGGR